MKPQRHTASGTATFQQSHTARSPQVNDSHLHIMRIIRGIPTLQSNLARRLRTEHTVSAITPISYLLFSTLRRFLPSSCGINERRLCISTLHFFLFLNIRIVALDGLIPKSGALNRVDRRCRSRHYFSYHTHPVPQSLTPLTLLSMDARRDVFVLRPIYLLVPGYSPSGLESPNRLEQRHRLRYCFIYYASQASTLLSLLS